MKNLNKKTRTKEVKDNLIASMITLFSQDYTIITKYNYINLSVDINKVGDAAIASMVMHSFHKRDLLPRRVPGSSPGRGASTFSKSYYSLK